MALLGSKPGSCGEKPTNNGLDHGTTKNCVTFIRRKLYSHTTSWKTGSIKRQHFYWLIFFPFYYPGKPGHKQNLNVFVCGFTSRNKSCNYCSWFLTTTTLRGVSDVTSCNNESQNAGRARRLASVLSPTQYALLSDGQSKDVFFLSSKNMPKTHRAIHSSSSSFLTEHRIVAKMTERESASP